MLGQLFFNTLLLIAHGHRQQYAEGLGEAGAGWERQRR